jgi:uncharacterized protein
MRLPARLAAAVVLLAALPATAVPVRGLYEAAVPVADQNPALRDDALRRALDAVLVRVTGSRDTTAAAGIVDRAGTLVQGYGYEAAPAGSGLRLRARFDPRAVDAALRSLGLPVWGANRLSCMAWIALRDDGGPRAVLDAAAVAARAPTVAATAEARGLPLAFPELDASERTLVRFDQVWSGAFEGVEGASRRYNPNLVLVGRVGREGGRWLGRWALLSGADTAEEWASAANSLDEVLAAGIDELADRQAQRFATQPGTTREMRLRVGGVDSLADYARVLNYLRGLNPVRDVQVEGAREGELLLRVRVEGDPETLARVIAAGRQLRREQDAGVQERYVLAR